MSNDQKTDKPCCRHHDICNRIVQVFKEMTVSPQEATKVMSEIMAGIGASTGMSEVYFEADGYSFSMKAVGPGKDEVTH